MSKKFSSILIAGCLMTSIVGYADAELTQCFSQHKGDPNVYKICYGQKTARVQEKRKQDDAARLQKVKQDVEQKTINVLKQVSEEKDPKPMISTDSSIYDSGSTSSTTSTSATPRPSTTPTQQQQQPATQQPQQGPAQPKKSEPVIKYY